MTPLTRRFGLLAGATLVALSLGGAYIAAQDTSGHPVRSWAAADPDGSADLAVAADRWACSPCSGGSI
jgi:hypothetical protein